MKVFDRIIRIRGETFVHVFFYIWAPNILSEFWTFLQPI